MSLATENIVSFPKRIKSYLKNSCFYRKPRRFQAYCVGMPKSGTHSIDGLLGKNYRSLHEPEFEQTWNIILNLYDGKVDEKQFLDYLRKRDKRLWLELDSSNLNYFFLDQLLQEFQGSKFILTIRDCYSWLASAINHRISRKAPVKNTLQKDKLRFGDDVFRYEPEEKILEAYGLPTINSFLSYWKAHNETVIQKVPSDRLLVIRTKEISESADKISQFLGVSPTTLNQEKSHLFKNPKREDILSKVDQSFLQSKVNEYCTDLMSEFFPEVMLDKK